MNILQVSELYPPALGGTERHVRNLSLALRDAGHRVGVLTLTAGGARPGESDDDGLAVTRVTSSFQRLWGSRLADPDKPYHPPAPDPAVTAAVRRVVAQGDYDVIHTHNWILYSVLAARTGVPVVHTVHDFSAVCARRDLLRRNTTCAGPSVSCGRCSLDTYGPAGPAVAVTLAATWRAHSSVAHLVAVSPEHAEASQRAFPNTPVTVIPSFVGDETEQLCQAPCRPGFVGDRPYLFFAGALSSTKGLDVLVEAYGSLRARLGDDCPDLVLAGTRRPDTPSLDLPGVTVAFDVPHDQVCAAHGHALATVIPSRVAESFGQVAVEAGLARTPAVVAAHGNLPRLVEHDVTGLHTTPGDAASLEAALVRICTEPGLARRLGDRAADRVRDYTASATAARVAAVLDDARVATAARRGRC